MILTVGNLFLLKAKRKSMSEALIFVFLSIRSFFVKVLIP